MTKSSFSSGISIVSEAFGCVPEYAPHFLSSLRSLRSNPKETHWNVFRYESRHTEICSCPSVHCRGKYSFCGWLQHLRELCSNSCKLCRRLIVTRQQQIFCQVKFKYYARRAFVTVSARTNAGWNIRAKRVLMAKYMKCQQLIEASNFQLPKASPCRKQCPDIRFSPSERKYDPAQKKYIDLLSYPSNFRAKYKKDENDDDSEDEDEDDDDDDDDDKKDDKKDDKDGEDDEDGR